MHSKVKHSFNVLLNPDEVTALTECSQRLGTSRGTIIRWAIIRTHRMICTGIPTCASGQACYVPHMHPASNLRPPDLPGQLTLPSENTSR